MGSLSRVEILFNRWLIPSLRCVSNQTTSATPAAPNVFATTLQDSPFIGRARPNHDRTSKPWVANLLKSFFVSQWQRQINSAVMYESCAKQALHSNFYKGARTSKSLYDLDNTFANNLELTSMHVWLCKTRIMCPSIHRSEEFDHAEARLFLQQLLERMWEHISRTLTGAGAHDIRLNKFLKEIQDSVFGSFIAYDQALARVLPASGERDGLIPGRLISDSEAAIESFLKATMSNFFGPTEAVRDDASTVEVAKVLATYMTGQLQRLEQCSDESLRSSGYRIEWEDPVSAWNIETKTCDEIRPASCRDQPAL